MALCSVYVYWAYVLFGEIYLDLIFFDCRFSGIKGVKALVSPPVQKNAVNLIHCARYVFLSCAID